MSNCRPPKVESYRHKPVVTPTTGSEAIYGTLGDAATTYAAVEIDPSSELDQCVVTSPDGTFTIAVGSPLCGPVRGPLVVRPSSADMPYSNDAPNYLDSGLNARPPLLALRTHTHTPAEFCRRRATSTRAKTSQATTSSYVIMLEGPTYGRDRAVLVIRNDGAESLTFAADGVTYLAVNSTEQETGAVSQSGTGVREPLALNSAGDVELSVAAGADKTVELALGVQYDTVAVYVKDAGSTTTARAWLRSQDAK